jgi:hypothetical protein
MADPLYPPTRPLSVGETLDSAFRIFGATLLRCLPYAVTGKIVGQLPNIYYLLTGRVRTLGLAFWDPLWWLLALVGMAVAVFMWCAMLLRQYGIATRHATTLEGELRTSAQRAPGVLLIGILIFVTFMVCALPIGFIAGIVRAFAGVSVGVGAGVAVVLLWLIPASWLLLRWSCAGTVYVLGDQGPLDSMRRSWHLTAGSYWRLTLIYSVALVLVLVLYGVSTGITTLVTLLLAGGDVALSTAVATAAAVLVSAIALPFYSALALVVLGDLSVRKEGTDLAQRIAAPAVQ